MHVVLLTLMTLSGADPIAVQQASGAVAYPPAAYATGCQGCGSTACNGSSCGFGGSHYDRRVNRQLQHYMSGRRHGPMPQTCYAPRFGCYNGNDRHMHRYPAFHGTYYRRPYNYRNLFEYPWHAEMHEPTSYFSYNVPPEAMNMPMQGQPIDAPPMLPPEAAAQRQAVPVAPPQPINQPVFAPRGNRSAGMVPAHSVNTVQFLPPPRLGDQDLSGVAAELTIEQQRVTPAPIESVANATPYEEGTRRDSPPAIVAPRSPSATPIMLQPVSNKAEPASQPMESQPVEAKPISARRSTDFGVPSPSVKAKPISLGQPQSLELKPLAAENNVTQAKAEQADNQTSQVQPTSAIEPVQANNALRLEAAPARANPLRGSLRR